MFNALQGHMANLLFSEGITLCCHCANLFDEGLTLDCPCASSKVIYVHFNKWHKINELSIDIVRRDDHRFITGSTKCRSIEEIITVL